MKYVHPKDLKIGDIVKYKDKKSWIRRKCDEDMAISKLKIGEIYEVFKIESGGRDHISGIENVKNPLVRLKGGDRKGEFSAWWGSWELVNREIEPKVYGIVKFCEQNYK